MKKTPRFGIVEGLEFRVELRDGSAIEGTVTRTSPEEVDLTSTRKYGTAGQSLGDYVDITIKETEMKTAYQI